MLTTEQRALIGKIYRSKFGEFVEVKDVKPPVWVYLHWIGTSSVGHCRIDELEDKFDEIPVEKTGVPESESKLSKFSTYFANLSEEDLRKYTVNELYTKFSENYKKEEKVF